MMFFKSTSVATAMFQSIFSCSIILKIEIIMGLESEGKHRKISKTSPLSYRKYLYRLYREDHSRVLLFLGRIFYVEDVRDSKTSYRQLHKGLMNKNRRARLKRSQLPDLFG